ncbi:MAG: Na(+)-translocating NADH-quinone reductase subunit A [Cyclobacteriaceae bacterium]|nr:Na(+)-translocating NADH-quinone reductase subunit A [Cyclobacteriaceae bacterium]
MSHTLKLKKGFDINLSGKAEKKLAACDQPKTFALKPTDFVGIQRPKVMVAVGDTVKAGTPLLFCKMMEEVKYCAPVSGEIIEIKRGDKRKLLEIIILADKEIVSEPYKKFSAAEIQQAEKSELVNLMINSGVWPNIIQRPYGVVANPADTPKSIFVSTFDTSPLAADISFVLKGEEKFFQAGIDMLKKLTPGKVNIGVNADVSQDTFSRINNAEIHPVSGKHPAGNVGVQIHHIDPIAKGDLVWTVSAYGVAQIGKLFLEGKYDASKVIALAGSEVKNPQYYKTYTGACINKFVEQNVTGDEVRFVSGNVLTGEKIKSDGYLGFYHQQVTVIPEGTHSEFLGWILPTTKKLSFHRAFGLLSFMNGNKKEYVVDTNMMGEHRAFVQTGVFEKVTPMDILPTYLIKAILAEDFDEMESLGIYEMIEEDIALCEFVDVSKNNLQQLLREGLTLIKNS